ncbi:phosphoenolpyruvate-protein phosphotransferase [Brevibacillus agri]|uniref:Phosphoenolpyruvate-protein phosphotransferase n=1 Tax=Brevibacillus agri TaxID=51101 RepID=A0A3M8ARK7_9BACL|nr:MULTISPECIES: phosphoenolpyruvate--protein phosphotransferase [Bacillota]EJL47313.1 phosphoenolpyruvate-protein phosphotransferase [Brevibacillus sp. CF112]MCG5250993.1 phosphoenolpyruvate--protein phosphotransferase [Brevibacillus agri]MDN4095398.1 phosphoenolpyruvate--protein phosphotransferase [Brevibacillus agri]MDT8018926.1 phosphoenolpyruvate--protein phosphotransferase [Clostridium perfringens]MED1822431.1 phosphoenolpyruvate--protein phosphotransferase [Brevibacillus agri]
MSQKIVGVKASAGVAIGKAFLLTAPDMQIKTVAVEDAASEIHRFEEALERAKADLQQIALRVEKEMGAEQADIFRAHLLVLEDPELVDTVKDKITQEMTNAESALHDVAQAFIGLFEQMDNDYMRERAADIRDVTKRVLAYLLGVNFFHPGSLTEEVIIVAEDLTPSDTAQLDRRYVKGFVTDIGGRTSHSAIMARSLEIPAVVGTQTITSAVQPSTLVILDGHEGVVIIDPSEEEIALYTRKQAEYAEQKAELEKLVHNPTITADQHHVELAANIGSPADVAGALANGAEGVGLFRTEFLYMGRDDFPTEEEQYLAYKQVLAGMGDKPVVIRTLDIGGDKHLSYLDMPEEMNPFLGYRAIRLCLDRQELFRTQLRALLRASAHGNLKIMFPMIATLEEFRAAKAILEEEKQGLQNSGVAVSDRIEVGIMIEIPAAAMMADVFAREVDFFSIGTNDLIQYTMAADRMNERVAYLYQPYHPAVLRLLRNVIEAGHSQGKWVGMCGEMAGDPVAVPILLGLGLDEFSMSASSILPARKQISQLSREEMAKHIDAILQMSTSAQVEAFVKETILQEDI